MRRLFLPIALLVGLTVLWPATQHGARSAPGAEPSASGVTAAAGEQDVLAYLQEISGTATVSGQHNREPLSEPTRWSDEVREITGTDAGLWGNDFVFTDIEDRGQMIEEAADQWRQGSIVTLSWHMCPPTIGEPCAWESNGIQSELSDQQWEELVTPGSDLHDRWLARLDTVVPFLEDLESQGVEVLWRPLHEMNDGWSWWGGRSGPDGSRRLYQLTHDHLVGTRGLTNLTWVWNVKDVGDDTFDDYYPGDAYVDVVSLDSWAADFPSTATYEALAAIAPGKPLALAEVGKLPSPAQLAAQPGWTYFMVWAEYLTGSASVEEIRATYADERVLTRDELTIGDGADDPTVPDPTVPDPTVPDPTTPPEEASGAITVTGGNCLDVEYARTADRTPVQLHPCNGTGAQDWSATDSGELRALGKCLDVSGGGTADGTRVQLYRCDATGAQVWEQVGGTLVNPQSGKCLDATGRSLAPGTRVQLWTCHGDDNQRWTLDPNPGPDPTPEPPTPEPEPEPEPDPTPEPPAGEVLTSFVTGYTLFDNDPPGSKAIAYPGSAPRHAEAGGTGTYDDPISLAAAAGKYAPGTRFYLPHVQRYFIVEDSCASCGQRPEWVDMWIGGELTDDRAAVDACMNSLTGTHTIERDPPRGRTVIAGPIFAGGRCNV